MSSEHHPIKSISFLSKQPMINNRYKGALHSDNLTVFLLFFCLITCIKGTSGVHSASTPFCGTIMAWHCSRLSTTHTSRHKDKESSPTAECVPSKGFCYACVRAYSMNTHTHTRATQTGMYQQSTVMFTIAPLQVFLCFPSFWIHQLSTTSTQLKHLFPWTQPFLFIFQKMKKG